MTFTVIPRRKETGMTKTRNVGTKLGVLVAAGATVVAMLGLPAAAAPSTGGAVHSGKVHANFVSTTDAGNGPGPLALRGAISAFCTDDQGQNVDHVVCPTGPGTFVIDHSAQPGKQHFSENQTTCVGVFTFSDAPFTVEKGTGAYKGISGHGLAHGTAVEVAPRLADGTCNPDPNATPVAGFTQIEATFTVSFHS
jgi:hypothetical protein